ncbi:DivIVA domain-containing protein [Actinophytocola xanthii]|nr:DivIVA domain-containing protein [Actinophytocola xanthii]
MTDDPPLLTPQAVEGVRFDAARFPSRGYNEDQVDDFLDRVAQTIAVLTATVEEQRREIDRIKHWRQTTGPVTGAPAWEAEARERAEAIVAAARVSAEEIRRLALANAQRVLGADHVAEVAGVVDRLHSVRDTLSAELQRLEATLDIGFR